MDLESLAALTAGVVCLFYALYGTALVVTRDGCGAKDGKPPLSVFKATLYCVLAVASSLVLILLFSLMRGWQGGSLASQLQTHGTVFASSAEGSAWRGYAIRYFLLSAGFGVLVFYWLQNQLISPLETCQALPRDQATKASDLVDTLAKLKPVVYLVFFLYVLGFLISFSQHQKFEQSVSGAGVGAAPSTGLMGSLFSGGTTYRTELHLPGAREARQTALEAAQEAAHAKALQLNERLQELRSAHPQVYSHLLSGHVPAVATSAVPAQAAHAPAHAPAHATSSSLHPTLPQATSAQSVFHTSKATL